MLIFYTVETQVRWLYGHMAIEFTLSDHLSVCLSLCLGRANAPVEYEKISNLLIWRNIINCHWNIIFCFSSLIFSIFFFFSAFTCFIHYLMGCMVHHQWKREVYGETSNGWNPGTYNQSQTSRPQMEDIDHEYIFFLVFSHIISGAKLHKKTTCKSLFVH